MPPSDVTSARSKGFGGQDMNQKLLTAARALTGYLCMNATLCLPKP